MQFKSESRAMTGLRAKEGTYRPDDTGFAGGC